MNSEESITASDFFLHEIPNVKISQSGPPPQKKVVKEELQFLNLADETQEQILETLRYIHGPDFKLKESSEYTDKKDNLSKKYWIGQGNLVIRGACDFSKLNSDDPQNEIDRLKQFALLRLESYGFHKNHCIEALQYCEGVVEDALFLLYHKYLKTADDNYKENVHDFNEKDIQEMREDEKSSLQSIYEGCFTEKVLNTVWIIQLKLDYLIKIFHNKEIIRPKQQQQYQKNPSRKKERCRNFIRGKCQYGDKCRFLHETNEIVATDQNSHLTEFSFDLEIRFPPNSTYPYEPPIIFLKTNAVLPNLVSLHICKRLFNEAKILAEDGIPSIYTIVELLKNENEIVEHLKNDIDFIDPNEKLFQNKNIIVNNKPRPSHYKKGITSKDNKKKLHLNEIQLIDEKLANKFLDLIKTDKYQEILECRKKLPAWSLINNILNTIQQSQVVIISGETGCGKSTQIPQFILDDWLINYKQEKKHIEIVCTQPRRISAIGVAERVAEERCERIGNIIGYQIRLENKYTINTRLTFCTTGILLRRLEGEPTLPTVTHIIVDEVHERSEDSDFLLLILKQLLPFRPDLKVILMSATMNSSLFCKYFHEIPVINIPGRTFPVTQYFLEDILENTGYILEEGSEYCKKIKGDDLDLQFAEIDIGATAKPNIKFKDEDLTLSQVRGRYENCSLSVCKNLFLMDPHVINFELIECILSWIVFGDHDHPKLGTILIFLPGMAEITSLYDQLSVHPKFGLRSKNFWLLPLHSSLSSEEQALIFKKPSDGIRKIILSTNIAETSVTIDDCVYVIDSGKMKEKHFDPNRNMESLETVWVTKANALQRKGRAGRVMSGVCIHLYTSHRFKHQMLVQPIPEIQRIPLEQLILNIKVLPNFENQNVTDVLNKFIEPPVKENIVSAIVRLQDAGALDKNEELTPLGHHLSELPVDVRIGKLMLYGAIFSSVDAALTMAACLSYKNPFVTPFNKKTEANQRKMKFATGHSDHITVLMAYKKWLTTYKKSIQAGRNFANENFLSQRTLITIADIKHQFLEYLVDIGFIAVNLTGKRKSGQDDVLTITGAEFNRNGENIGVLSSILCAALYPNIVKILTPPKSYVMSAGGAVPKVYEAKDLKFATAKEIVFMHPSSINYTVSNFTSPYLVYQEKIRTSKVFFRDCTMVPIIPLVLFSGYELDVTVRNGCTFISLGDGFILFQVEQHRVAEMIKVLRMELFTLLEEKIKDPLLNLIHHDKGEKIITTILNLIKTK